MTHDQVITAIGANQDQQMESAKEWYLSVPPTDIRDLLMLCNMDHDLFRGQIETVPDKVLQIFKCLAYMGLVEVALRADAQIKEIVAESENAPE